MTTKPTSRAHCELCVVGVVIVVAIIIIIDNRFSFSAIFPSFSCVPKPSPLSSLPQSLLSRVWRLQCLNIVVVAVGADVIYFLFAFTVVLFVSLLVRPCAHSRHFDSVGIRFVYFLSCRLSDLLVNFLLSFSQSFRYFISFYSIFNSRPFPHRLTLVRWF